MQVKSKTIYYTEDFEFTFNPIEDTLKIKKTKNGYEARYLVQDIDGGYNPFEDEEGNGEFIHWKDFGHEQYLRYCELLGYNPDTREIEGLADLLAVKIDKYEHSGVSYSVSGEGYQCKWDTSKDWAVWYPDKVLLEDIKRFKTKKTQRKRAIELARQACKLHNQWANGDVYLIVVERYDKDKNQIDYDCCGGYFGYDYALKALETDI